MVPILEMVALSIWQSFNYIQFNEISYNSHAEFCTWMGVSVRLMIVRVPRQLPFQAAFIRESMSFQWNS